MNPMHASPSLFLVHLPPPFGTRRRSSFPFILSRPSEPGIVDIGKIRNVRQISPHKRERLHRERNAGTFHRGVGADTDGRAVQGLMRGWVCVDGRGEKGSQGRGRGAGDKHNEERGYGCGCGWMDVDEKGSQGRKPESDTQKPPGSPSGSWFDRFLISWCA